ncbi:speckle-type POZ protein [Caerostris extrusa]|uniref:Speckle-type POZ protein n=1 Tax=Caerostris extrusa TaxID=172846 RepID=A0AAV4RJI7_CAEEX|nr:speckle-type POZ protein [Caerostris extrusa]
MYTDTLDDLCWENASQLFSAADKYQITALRNECSVLLKDKLSHANACQILILADTHQDESLKKIVQAYIVSNNKYIFKLEEWKLLMEDAPKLAAETMFQNFVN